MNNPNILFILTDHCRPDALGKATPNVNSLANRGVKFENCYSASPLCQPARASIVTGKPLTHHGVCGNMSEPISMEERQDTFMQHLKEEGYRTALIGKHHYYDRYNIGMDVTDDDEDIKGYGYDHVWQVVDVGESRHNEDRYTKKLSEKGKLQERRRELRKNGAAYVSQLDKSESVDGYIGEKSVEYIKSYSGNSPLFLNVGFVGPHPPYWVPREFDVYSPEDMSAPKGVNNPAEIERTKRIRAKYLGKVAFIDHYVGKLSDALEEKGMLENTLIVFTSDHGDNLGDYGIRDKRFFYEQSVKVPLVMAGPEIEINRRLGGTICKALVSNIDLYATFLDAAGCQNIHGKSQREGISLLEIANGSGNLRREVYSELGTSMMVRGANWKLVFDPEQDGVQYLFNLRRDSDELDNLAGVAGYRDIETKLIEKLLSRLIRMTHYTHDKEQRRVQRVRV